MHKVRGEPFPSGNLAPVTRGCLMAAAMSSPSDERIGGFRYVRTIHPGATTAVLEVVQETTKRRFALKQMLESRASSEDRKRFAFEAKLGMQLFHPNLIRVHEFFPGRPRPISSWTCSRRST